MAKKLFIKSYGCQMNVYDSERMGDLLKPHGYALSDTAEGADVVILNTCHIREKATEKVYSDLGRLKPIKDEKESHDDSMIITVAGCTAQAEGAEITRRIPFVDLVLGPQTYHRLPELLEKIKRQKEEERRANDFGGPLRKSKKFIETDFPVESKFDFLPEERATQGTKSAFLTIQEGCDKFCTFCCVPYTRGAEFSRPALDIIKEAKQLATQGVCEITLLGQNVNAYHGQAPEGVEEWGLGRLIFEIAEIPGLKRLRYMTSHPRDFDEMLIKAHGEIDSLMPFVHLPVQSGSDKILKAMNRGHTAAFYRDIIEKIRAKRSDIAFSSDFIVGFPGETRADFADTLKLVTDVDYAQAYSFSYSPRPGTPAASLEDQIPREEKEERLQVLQELIRSQQLRFNAQCQGMVLPVLFEKEGKLPHQYIGRTPYLQSVHVMSESSLIGSLHHVKIIGGHQNSLLGEFTEGKTAASV